MSERYVILCVDDDVSGLEARTALLEQEGYSVTAVSRPLWALEFAVTKFHLLCWISPCPVLTDLISYYVYGRNTHLSRWCCSAL